MKLGGIFGSLASDALTSARRLAAKAAKAKSVPNCNSGKNVKADGMGISELVGRARVKTKPIPPLQEAYGIVFNELVTPEDPARELFDSIVTNVACKDGRLCSDRIIHNLPNGDNVVLSYKDGLLQKSELIRLNDSQVVEKQYFYDKFGRLIKVKSGDKTTDYHHRYYPNEVRINKFEDGKLTSSKTFVSSGNHAFDPEFIHQEGCGFPFEQFAEGSTSEVYYDGKKVSEIKLGPGGKHTNWHLNGQVALQGQDGFVERWDQNGNPVDKF